MIIILLTLPKGERFAFDAKRFIAMHWLEEDSGTLLILEEDNRIIVSETVMEITKIMCDTIKDATYNT